MSTLPAGTIVRCERRGLGVVIKQARATGAVVVGWQRLADFVAGHSPIRPVAANVVRVRDLAVVWEPR